MIHGSSLFSSLFDRLKQGHWPVFFISLLAAVMNLFLPIILVRLLSTEDIGTYKIFFLYAQSIIFISLAGGPLYSVYYFVGKKLGSNRYLEQAWILNFAISLFCALLGFIFIEQISVLISMSEKKHHAAAIIGHNFSSRWFLR